MNKNSNLLWGLVLIFVGVIFGLNALGITDISIFFNGWWTLFIIFPSFIDLFKEKDKTGSVIGLVIGLSLLLGCNDIIDFDLIWKLMVPVILVIIGLSLIFKDSFNNKIKKEIEKLNKNIGKEYYATFSGQNIEFSNEDFTGCDLNAIFGGIKCDLRNSKIKKDAVINASSIFGGITIYVPSNVDIKVVSNSIFGGVEDERKDRVDGNKVIIYINATCLFGGLEIK